MRQMSLILFGLFPASAIANTLIVPSQYPDLSEAMREAACGDTIILMAGSWSPPGVPLTCEINIVGAGSSSTIISGWGSGEDTIQVNGAIGFTIQGVTVVADNGVTPIDITSSSGTLDDIAVIGQNNVTSAIQIQNSEITLSNSYFSSNDSGFGLPGHLYITLNSEVTVTNTSFLSGSTAASNGGAIAVYNSTLNLNLNDFTENQTDQFGGAIYGSQSTISVDSSTFTDNSSGGNNTSGGAAINVEWSTLSVNGTQFSRNIDHGFSAATGASEGGAIRFASPFSNDTLTVTNSTFNENYAYKGGAIAVSDTSRDNALNVEVNIEGSSFNTNAAHRGGALFMENPTDNVEINIKTSTFENHWATLEGGAMWFGASDQNANMTLTDSVLNHNSADGDGGALRLDRLFQVTAQRNAFCGNTTINSRGAAVASNDITDTNDWASNTFWDNDSRVEASFWSEVIYDTGTLAPLNLTNNLFFDNVANQGTSAAVRSRSDGGNIANNYFGWNSSFTQSVLIANLMGGYAAPTVDFNGWHNNTGGKISYLATGSTAIGASGVTGAPGLIDYLRDGDCSNDDHRPTVTSRMVDAGNPTYSDPAGYPGVNEASSDIGAWGGPFAPEEDWADDDTDNWPAMWDCNDDAPGIYPLATDVCGDGIDADCDGIGLATDDEDGDTLDFDEEAALGTDPCLADTDGDNINDNAESSHGTNPTDEDTDGDTLSDGDEVNIYSTSPLLEDSDTDSINDGDEVTIGSNPLTGDSDADGVSDFDELGSVGNPTNTDNDGLYDIIDADDDDDGIDTILENQNAFGLACSLLTDCDGDTLLDSDEWSFSGDLTDPTPQDFDDDGDPDINDADDDDDTIPTSVEADQTDAYDDNIDGTEGPNWHDLDSDGDNNPDEVEILEADSDGDGITDWADPDDFDGPGRDDDFDGSPNAYEVIAGTDPFDSDSDDDGVLDGVEIGDDHFNPLNSDGTGAIDALDDDDDDDGILTWDEDLNGNGDWFDDDTDGNEVPNFRQRDDDGDGINSDDESLVDDEDGDGLTDWLDSDHTDGPIADADGDGIDNQTEWDLQSDPNSNDSDGDGILDADEIGDSDNPTDTDGDNAPDIIDPDDDGDGLATIEEAEGDADGDELPNHLDPDSDNDGAVDGSEGTDDSDNDGIPDYLDDGRTVGEASTPADPPYGIGGCSVAPATNKAPFPAAFLLILTACAGLRRRRDS